MYHCNVSLYLNRGVGLLEVGFGNLPSLKRVLKQLGVSAEEIHTPNEVLVFGHVIIPGVGAFNPAMNFLEKENFVEIIRERCLTYKMPTMGICLGAQILLEKGYEGQERNGLGVFQGNVVSASSYLETKDSHNGWDMIQITKSLLSIEPGTKADGYFNHEYIFNNNHHDEIYAVTDFGGNFPVILKKEKTYAVQFHPEKSQAFGLNLLKGFLELE